MRSLESESTCQNAELDDFLQDSAYIEFETPEQAQEVAKKSIKYKDTELLLKTK